MAKKLKVIAIKCPLCGATIYSRDLHDFRYCLCGSDKHGDPKGVDIDGGRSYTHIGWNDKKIPMPKVFKIEIKATKLALVADYLYGKDKYGMIHDLKARVKNGIHSKGEKEMTKKIDYTMPHDVDDYPSHIGIQIVFSAMAIIVGIWASLYFYSMVAGFTACEHVHAPGAAIQVMGDTVRFREGAHNTIYVKVKKGKISIRGSKITVWPDGFVEYGENPCHVSVK
jgi:hypothetical protein